MFKTGDCQTRVEKAIADAEEWQKVQRRKCSEDISKNQEAKAGLLKMVQTETMNQMIKALKMLHEDTLLVQEGDVKELKALDRHI